MIGEIAHFYGPFEPQEEVTGIKKATCLIGISIGQKDCMVRQNGEYLFYDQRSNNQKNPIMLRINNRDIQLGKTFIYETEEPIEQATLSFPNGAPESTKIEVIYLS